MENKRQGKHTLSLTENAHQDKFFKDEKDDEKSRIGGIRILRSKITHRLVNSNSSPLRNKTPKHAILRGTYPLVNEKAQMNV
jgi:hypothetical protein